MVESMTEIVDVALVLGPLWNFQLRMSWFSCPPPVAAVKPTQALPSPPTMLAR
jgi:hypothetical protein